MSKEPNLYVKSCWELISSEQKEIEMDGTKIKLSVDKLKIKLIVSISNKDITIKNLVNSLIFNLKKKDKKNNEYLKNISTV